jgi:hypothetical protein
MSQLGTGKIVYNPKNRVPKKKELAIQRTYAQDAIQLIAENLSSLENQELATSILADFAANRHHYVVTPRPAHAEHLATLYRFLEQEPITNTFFNVVEAKMCKTTTPPWTAIVTNPDSKANPKSRMGPTYYLDKKRRATLSTVLERPCR